MLLSSSVSTSRSKAVPAKKVSSSKAKSKPQNKDKPKRPLSAYNLFFQHERDRLLRGMNSPFGYSHDANHCTLGRDPSARANRSKKVRPPPHGKIGFAQLAKTIGANWKVLDKSAREYFENLAKGEKERYRQEVDAWRSKRAFESSAVSSNNKDNNVEGATKSKGPLPTPISPNTPQVASPKCFAPPSGEILPLPPPPLSHSEQYQHVPPPPGSMYRPHQQPYGGSVHPFLPPHSSNHPPQHQQEYYYGQERLHSPSFALNCDFQPPHSVSASPRLTTGEEDAEPRAAAPAPGGQHYPHPLPHQRHNSWHSGWNEAHRPAPQRSASLSAVPYSPHGGYGISSYPQATTADSALWQASSSGRGGLEWYDKGDAAQSAQMKRDADKIEVAAVVPPSESTENGNKKQPQLVPSSAMKISDEQKQSIQDPRDMLDFLNEFVCDD